MTSQKGDWQLMLLAFVIANPYSLLDWSSFQHGVSSRTFNYVDHFAFWRIIGWLRKRHVGLGWGTLQRRFLPQLLRRWQCSWREAACARWLIPAG